MPATLNIRQVDDPTDPDALRLKALSDHYLEGLYPPESNHSETLQELLTNESVFFAGEHDGKVVACGAIKFCQHDVYYGEVKSVFVDPASRGQRLATQLMAHLEQYVKSQGCTLIRLETGPVQPAAIRLYESIGYSIRGPYGAYLDDPLSVFMEKIL